MSKRDSLVFGIAGLAAWAAASLFYAAFGAGLLEAAFWFYCLNAFAAAGAFAFLFRLTARLTRRPRGRLLAPALAFTLPGVAGGGALLALFRTWPPGADPASVGRYAAFLLVAYLVVAAVALETAPARGARRVRDAAPAR